MPKSPLNHPKTIPHRPSFIILHHHWSSFSTHHSSFIIIHHSSSFIIHHSSSFIFHHRSSSWIILIRHAPSWIIMIHHESLLWFIMIHCESSRIHESSWFIMNHHDSSWIIMNQHDSASFSMEIGDFRRKLTKSFFPKPSEILRNGLGSMKNL